MAGRGGGRHGHDEPAGGVAIERHGGIDAAVPAAEARGVHLVALTDDKGTALVAASLHPFTAPC